MNNDHAAWDRMTRAHSARTGKVNPRIRGRFWWEVWLVVRSWLRIFGSAVLLAVGCHKGRI